MHAEIKKFKIGMNLDLKINKITSSKKYMNFFTNYKQFTKVDRKEKVNKHLVINDIGVKRTYYR